MSFEFENQAPTGALRRAAHRMRRYRLVGLLIDLVRRPQTRSYWLLRLTRPDNAFQPYSDTASDRYPEIFAFVSKELGDGASVRLLSFGCSTGEEVFTLRRYFPQAEIKGLDINPLHIAMCQRRRRTSGDERMSFAIAGSLDDEQPGSYDAVFCMAVLRHGDLSFTDAERCDHLITFDAFERTVADLALVVKPGGLLAIQHSNFRFCDSGSAAEFDVAFSVDNGHFHPNEPLFGPDNNRMHVPSYPDVLFRKRVA
jgi:SAM-dependent methyltransferase